MSDSAFGKKGEKHIEHVDEQAARIGNFEEQNGKPLQTIKQNPKAVAWCLYVIWLLVLNSFEDQAAGAVLSIPQFRKDFGHAFGADYVLDAEWQSAFSGGPVASAIIGSIAIGYIADRIGRKLAIAICFIFSIIGITIEVIATTNAVFFAGKFVNGFAIGGLITTCFAYVGEVAPTALRGILTAAAAIAFTVGPLLVALIVKGTGTYTTRWAYRAVFVSQYGVLGLGLIFWPFMPESPWWLVSTGNKAGAAKALSKLGYSSPEVEKRLAAISLTLDEVRQETSGVTYVECFRKSNLRRTMISIAPLAIQALSGVYFAAAYSTYYFQLAGFSADMSFTLQIIQQIASLSGNVCSWFLIDRLGRRSLTFYGLLIITIDLLVIGVLAILNSIESLKGSCALIIIYCFLYNATIGATGFTILTEVSTSRLRVKTIAIGNSLQKAIYTFWSFVFPYLFNPDQANLGAKTCFIFGGLAVLSLIYLWFCQPETAGRTYEELDELFMKQVSARKFKSTKTEAELRAQQAVEIENTSN